MILVMNLEERNETGLNRANAYTLMLSLQSRPASLDLQFALSLALKYIQELWFLSNIRHCLSSVYFFLFLKTVLSFHSIVIFSIFLIRSLTYLILILFTVTFLSFSSSSTSLLLFSFCSRTTRHILVLSHVSSASFSVNIFLFTCNYFTFFMREKCGVHFAYVFRIKKCGVHLAYFFMIKKCGIHLAYFFRIQKCGVHLAYFYMIKKCGVHPGWLKDAEECITLGYLNIVLTTNSSLKWH